MSSLDHRPSPRTVRALTAALTIDALGSGMYVPFSLIFFRHVTGLPLTTIGLVLTATGLAGMAVLPVTGGLIDRYGARRMQLAGYLVRGLGFCLYPVATTLPRFAAVALLTVVATRAFPAIQQSLIGQLFDGVERDRFQALSRSLSNGGLGAGTLLAALLVAEGGSRGFVIAAWLNAASFFAAALIVRTFAGLSENSGVVGRSGTIASAGREVPTGGLRAVAADRPFLGLTFANLLIALGYSAPAVLLPIYCVTVLHTSTVVSSALFAINTALCAFAGVPVGRLARRSSRRTRAAALGASLLAVAFLVFAAIGAGHWRNSVALLGALALTMVLYTAGEMIHNPAASTLALSAASPQLRGRYMATYQLSWSLATALAPSVFTALLDAGAVLPWVFLSGSVLAGAAMLVVLERFLPRCAVLVQPVGRLGVA